MARSHQGSLFACPSVCLCVCLSASMSLKTAGPDFTYFSVNVTCDVARSSSAGIAICYVFPVSCMTSHFPTKATCRYRCSDATAALLAGYYYYYLKKNIFSPPAQSHRQENSARRTKLWFQRQFTLLPWCSGQKPHFLFAEPWTGVGKGMLFPGCLL